MQWAAEQCGRHTPAPMVWMHVEVVHKRLRFVHRYQPDDLPLGRNRHQYPLALRIGGETGVQRGARRQPPRLGADLAIKHLQRRGIGGNCLPN